MQKTTYAAALTAVFNALGAAGWTLSDPALKVRHATTPDGVYRVWFKARALYYTVAYPGAHNMGNARTITYDTDIARRLSTAAMVAYLNKDSNDARKPWNSAHHAKITG